MVYVRSVGLIAKSSIPLNSCGKKWVIIVSGYKVRMGVVMSFVHACTQSMTQYTLVPLAIPLIAINYYPKLLVDRTPLID